MIGYEAKSDLTRHNTKIHAQHECKVCKSQKYGENDINDHTKECISKRDAKRKENDKKDADRKKAHPQYKNMHWYFPIVISLQVIQLCLALPWIVAIWME